MERAADGRSIMGLVRPEILALPGYEAVEPIEILARRLRIAPDRIAKLDANENPYGASPRAIAALAALRDIHIYPDPDQGQLRAAIAKHLGVPADGIVPGAGSDEIIQLLCSVFLAPGDSVIDLVPTFGMYSFETGIAGGRSIDVQRRPDFTVDVAAVAERMTGRTRLIFATSPNNPTGNLLSAAELDDLLDLELPVVVDEAYIEFASSTGFAAKIAQRPNLIVLRTFSKWAGLAGLRVGYAVMNPELAECLFRIRQPYSISLAAEAAAVASLEDAGFLMERVQAIVTERERLFAGLQRIAFLQPIRSEANFILCTVIRGDARSLRDRLREQGVFVRYFDRDRLTNCIRISVGLPRHTHQVIEALTSVGVNLGIG